MLHKSYSYWYFHAKIQQFLQSTTKKSDIFKNSKIISDIRQKQKKLQGEKQAAFFLGAINDSYLKKTLSRKEKMITSDTPQTTV
jgi:hypothetical protein